ncbi:MAG: GYD domain-containing protein [Chloroflexota bacterium]
MAYYVMLTKLTDEGRKTIKSNPKRIREVNKEVEAMGVKILCQYFLLGPYDFVNILEAPDNKTMSKVALELGARGTVETMTMAAMPVDEIV